MQAFEGGRIGTCFSPGWGPPTLPVAHAQLQSVLRQSGILQQIAQAKRVFAAGGFAHICQRCCRKIVVI